MNGRRGTVPIETFFGTDIKTNIYYYYYKQIFKQLLFWDPLHQAHTMKLLERIFVFTKDGQKEYLEQFVKQDLGASPSASPRSWKQ
jgi:hypothetical protein